MNNFIILNAREILYLSALVGANEFFGVPDGFYGMDEVEIKEEILKLQNSLMDKQYAELDFNGNYTIAETIKSMIIDCALCDKYITFDKVLMGNQSKKLIYYIKGDEIIELSQKDAEYVLTKKAQHEIKLAILENIVWLKTSETTTKTVLLQHELLSNVKSMDALSNPEKELTYMGCDNLSAKIIYNGLSGMSNYYSIVIVDFENEEAEVMSLMVINSKSGSMELIPVTENEKDAVKFRPIDHKILKDRLEAALKKIGIVNSGEDFI